jgi:hypothetical protein
LIPSNAHMHDSVLSWLDTATSKKSGEGEIMRTCVFHMWITCQPLHLTGLTKLLSRIL